MKKSGEGLEIKEDKKIHCGLSTGRLKKGQLKDKNPPTPGQDEFKTKAGKKTRGGKVKL